MYASQNGHVEVVNTLLQHGASVEMPDNVRRGTGARSDSVNT